MKKVVSFLVSMAMVFSIFPVVSQAATSGTCGDNLTWILSDDGVLTISGTGDMWDDMVLSDSWNSTEVNKVVVEDGVTSIGAGVFFNCGSLTSVTINNTVTSIGDYAFERCTSLTSVTMPENVKNIGNGAFSLCSSLKEIIVDDKSQYYESDDGVLYNKGKTELITYPSGKDQETFVISDSVTSIGFGAFYGCSSLADVTIPDSVTSIGNNAFRDCYSLTDVTIPDGVTSIGFAAFYGCTKLTEARIGNGVISIGNSSFSDCDSLTDVTIPDSVMSIGDSAFRDCYNLTSVTIGSGVTSIGRMAFYYCDSLTRVTIPNSVMSIGDYAFEHCYSLTNVTLGNSVTSIGNYAFSNCYSLTNMTIPDSVISIGEDAFDGSVTIYGYDGSVAEKYASDNGNTFIAIEKPLTHSILVKNIQIGENVLLEAELTTPDTYTGKIIFAAYDRDGRLVDAKIYNAAASIEDISISKGTATSAKLFWWNMDTLDAYCECVPVAIN